MRHAVRVYIESGLLIEPQPKLRINFESFRYAYKTFTADFISILQFLSVFIYWLRHSIQLLLFLVTD